MPCIVLFHSVCPSDWLPESEYPACSVSKPSDPSRRISDCFLCWRNVNILAFLCILETRLPYFFRFHFHLQKSSVALRLVTGIFEGWRRKWVSIPWILPNVTAGVPPPPSGGFHIWRLQWVEGHHKADERNKISWFVTVTGGVKKFEHFADVIHGSPLIAGNQAYHY